MADFGLGGGAVAFGRGAAVGLALQKSAGGLARPRVQLSLSWAAIPPLPRRARSARAIASPVSAVLLARTSSPCLRRRAALVSRAAAAGATRPNGEPAWHRRARRARGHARTLLRVAGAGALLSNHHSAQRPSRGGEAMVRRTYGRGSNAEDASLRSQLLQLLGGGGGGGARGGGSGGGGGNGGGGGRGSGGTAAAARPQQSRQGDWTCRQCQFPNFAFRKACLRCRASAQGQVQRPLSTQHTAALRPQTAARPTRPHLSAAEARAAAARAGEPTYRAPRPPAAAPGGAPSGNMDNPTHRGTASGQEAPVTGGGAAGQPGQAAAAGRTDTSTASGPPAAVTTGVGLATAAAAPLRRRRWADEVPPCDRMADVDEEGDSYYEDEDAMWEEEEDEEHEECNA